MWKIDKGSRSGVTTAAFQGALDWNVEELREKTILLQNTDAQFALQYRLLAYAAAGGIGSEEVAATLLLPGQIAKMQLRQQWSRLRLEVPDGSGTAAYRVDYIGQGA